MVDGTQPLESDLAQTAPDGIANDQRPREHGGGHGGAKNDRNGYSFVVLQGSKH